MSRAIRSAIVLAFAALAGCATKLPLVEPTYDGTSSIRTQQVAKLQYITRLVEGAISQPMRVMPVAGAYIAVPNGPTLDKRFGETDQRDSTELLAAELERLSMVKTALVGPAIPGDLSITLDFLKAQLVHQSLFYVLDVKMTVESASKRAEYVYHIDVHEQDSAAERWHSTYSRNKVKAKKLLLKSAIPDIEAFLAGTP